MKLGKLLLLGSLLLAALGCTTGTYPMAGRSLEQYPYKELDFVSKSIERFGTMAISAPALIEPDPRFRFNLNKSPEDIYNEERIEGTSWMFQQDMLDFQASVLAELVPEAAGAGGGGPLEKLLSLAKPQDITRLLSGTPEEKRAAAQDLLQRYLADRSGRGESATGDGGQGALESAKQRVEAAVASLTVAQQSREQMVASPSTDAERETNTLAAASIKDRVRITLEEYAQAGSRVVEGAEQVMQLAAAVRGRGDSAASEEGPSEDALTRAEEARTDAKTAKENAQKLIAALKEQLGGLDAVFKKPEEATAKADAVLPLGTPPFKELSPGDIINGLDGAVEKIIGAAAQAGVTVQPPRKLLEAEEIARDKREALKQLQKASVPLPKFGSQNDPLAANLHPHLRDTYIQTFGDFSTLKELEWLSYPEKLGPGKRAFLCMASVNVVPGQLTYRGYRGVVDVSMAFASSSKCEPNSVPPKCNHQCDEKCNPKCLHNCNAPNFTGATPMCFAAFPFSDNQFLDLRTSRRQVFTMALQLVVNGYPEAGRAMLDYARQREHDVATITTLNTVSSFSSGNQVGFSFSPRLVAQDDPSNINASPALDMQPQTFPAVLLIVCDERDLKSETNPDGADQMFWFQSYHWMRNGSPRLDKYPGGRAWSDLRRPRYSGKEAILRGVALDAAKTKLFAMPGYNGAVPPANTGQGRLRAEINSLEGLVGRALTFNLPIFETDGKGVVPVSGSLAVHPQHGWLDQPMTYTVNALAGASFPVGVTATFEGQPVECVRDSPWQLRVKVPALDSTLGLEGTSEMADFFTGTLVIATGKTTYSTSIFLKKAAAATNH